MERHLIDGDIVLFNRQPSLHKLSIMAHIVSPTVGLLGRLENNRFLDVIAVFAVVMHLRYLNVPNVTGESQTSQDIPLQ